MAKVANLRTVLLCIFLALAGSCVAADDTINNLVTELKQRTKTDVPTLAEYDVICRYRNESWTIHSVSFIGRQSPAPGNAMKGEASNRLNVLFPTYTFMAIASCLDPLSLGLMLEHASPHLLPSEKVEGRECKVLELDGLPPAGHLGAAYPLPDLQKATVRLYLYDGRIQRIAAEIRRKPVVGDSGPPLFVECNPHYRRPRTAPMRVQTGNSIAKFELPDNRSAGVYSIAWSPDGKSIACYSFNNGLKLFSPENGSEIRTIPSHLSTTQVRFTSDSKYVVALDLQECFLYYSDAATGQKAKAVSMRGDSDLLLSPNAARALVWSNNPRLRVIDCLTGQMLCDLSEITTRDAQFNADGTQLALLQGNRLLIKDALDGHDLHSFLSKCEQYGDPGHAGLWRMAFSPDSKLIAIAGGSRGVSLYNLLEEREQEPMRVFVYEIETGRLVHTLTGLHGSVSVIRFSPDGGMLAVGEADDRGEAPGDNAAVLLWETKNWRSLGAIAVQPQTAVRGMEFSPDGKKLATADEHSPSVEVWLLPHP